MFSAGDRIGQFRVVREIGQGGMGCVYEVVADENAKRLALKVFSLDHGNREFLRRRFLAEAKILSRLNHPRLVHVHESGIDESSGTPYYVMDLVQSAVGKSETLEDVRKAGKVTEARALQWLADICEGLEYIHAQGVVHRDVKLENVLIDENGHAVLSDFGVSRIFDDRLRNELMVTTTFIAGETTGTQPVMGTYWYLAPEIRKGGVATPESDWYSLGVLMYRLLTGMWYEPNTKAFDLLAPFSKDCRRIVRRLLSDDAGTRRPRPEDFRTHGAGASRPRVVEAILGVLFFVLLGLSAWLCFSPDSSSSPSPSSSPPPYSPPHASTSTSFSLHYCKGVDFAFCPCPAGTNALNKISIAVTRPYWLGEAPVTWRQWRTVRGENYEGGWNGRGGAPATYLTYDEASSFCARLTRRFAKDLPKGYEIRLPTVAEWRLAYQVGQTVTNQTEGDTYAARRARCEIGWFGQGANGQWVTSNMKRYFEDRNRKVQLVSETWPDFPPRQIDSKESNWLRYSSKFVPVPAKLKPANRLGLYDMYGNCYEMCLDCVSTNGVNRVMSEFGSRVGNLYSGMGLSLVDPLVLSGPMPTMLGTYITPGLPGDEVWSTFFDRLPHLGFRLCIGPKMEK